MERQFQEVTLHLVIFVLLMLGCSAGVYGDQIDENCWQLTFSDDFESLSLWDSSTNEGTWKTEYIWPRDVIINNELQYYIDPRLHSLTPYSVSNGIFSISAIRTPESLRDKVLNSKYVSGVVTTQKSFSQKYGRFEIRAQVPPGRGLWPAFWLLPSFDKWPEGIAILPEIDVMEFIGSELQTYHTTVHTNQSGELKSYPTDHNNLGDLTQDFNIYSVVWDANTISWYFNKQQMAEHPTPSDLHDPMHMLINLAVGGNWAGAPDNNTEFPAEYQVDYVRVYNKKANCN